MCVCVCVCVRVCVCVCVCVCVYACTFTCIYLSCAIESNVSVRSRQEGWSLSLMLFLMIMKPLFIYRQLHANSLQSMQGPSHVYVVRVFPKSLHVNCNKNSL